jgi:hypothetical protein
MYLYICFGHNTWSGSDLDNTTKEKFIRTKYHIGKKSYYRTSFQVIYKIEWNAIAMQQKQKDIQELIKTRSKLGLRQKGFTKINVNFKEIMGNIIEMSLDILHACY